MGIGRRVTAAIALVLVAAAACGEDEGGQGGPSAEGEPIEVVASFYPVAEAAARVGGDRVKVANLVPPGVEPHDLELTSREIDTLQGASVVLYVGHGLQPAVEDSVKGLKTAVDVTESIAFDGRDPHFWLDPTRLAKVVDDIQARLAKVAGSKTAAIDFQARAAAYKEELAGLDGEITAGLKTCARRQIVTAHNAFHYFAQRYNLEQVPIAGLSPDDEPNAGQLAELADVVRRSGTTTIFYESLASPKVAETLARETKTKTAVLNPIEGLTQPELDAGATYVSVMRANLAALRSALDCA